MYVNITFRKILRLQAGAALHGQAMNLKFHNPAEGAFQTATSDLYLRIRAAIISGELGPGERLVRRSLAEKFGVSRVPVTEALIKLEQDGLVESAPMYGTRVKSVTEQSIRDEQQLREALECLGARLCAEQKTAKSIRLLRELAQEVDIHLNRKARQPEKGSELHLEFHLEIARQTGNQLLAKELTRVGFLELMRLNWINATSLPMPPDWHQTLVDAMATGKPNVAEEAMRKHVRYGIENLLQAVRQR